MLGETTQKLLRDIFNREDLFADFPRIRRRVVKWGPKGRPFVLPHSAVVVSEKGLLERIQSASSQEEDLGRPAWTIFASIPLPSVSVEYRFGSRPAAASAVTLERGADAEACWIESLENGWLFLLPDGKRTGWLLSVGDSVEAQLGGSQLIKGQISSADPASGIFASHPRIAYPLSAPGWLACGTAAIGFDPLCGDGVGNAAREAILASALIRAAIERGNVDRLVAHYQARLLAGFKRHMALCYDFYQSGHSGSWWLRQLDDLKSGLEWCSEQLASTGAFRYRLDGFTLEPAE
jgi:hypothetical protein